MVSYNHFHILGERRDLVLVLKGRCKFKRGPKIYLGGAEQFSWPEEFDFLLCLDFFICHQK